MNRIWPKALMGCLLSLGIPACQFFSATSPAKIVVLYTTVEPIIPVLPKDCCLYIPLEGFRHDTQARAKTVIVAGHGKPPYFASHTYEFVAQAVASFQPELVVMNSCYGASTDILTALANRNLDAYVVAPPFPIYQPGFIFDPAFFTGTLKEKVRAVRTEPPYPILRWKINQGDLQGVQAQIATMSPAALKKNLRRVQPALVKVKFPTEFEKNSEILVPLPPERFK